VLLILNECEELICRLTFYEGLSIPQIAARFKRCIGIISRHKNHACAINNVKFLIEMKPQFILQFPKE